MESPDVLKTVAAFALGKRSVAGQLQDDCLDAASGQAIVDLLAERGVIATYREYQESDEEESEIYTVRGIVCRQADVDEANRALRNYLSAGEST